MSPRNVKSPRNAGWCHAKVHSITVMQTQLSRLHCDTISAGSVMLLIPRSSSQCSALIHCQYILDFLDFLKIIFLRRFTRHRAFRTSESESADFSEVRGLQRTCTCTDIYYSKKVISISLTDNFGSRCRKVTIS
jgi:hypothetical protein